MRYAISIVILLNSFLLFGQTPSGDQSWSVHFEDNFTSSQVNTSKWTFNPPWGNCDGGAHQTSSGGNHDLTTNGILPSIIYTPLISFGMIYLWETTYPNPFA